MKSIRFFSVVMVLIVLITAGCKPSEAKIQEAIAQTQAAMPTNTPVPTSIPTPVPTPTSIPSVPGIDFGLPGPGNINLFFDSYEVVNGPVTIGGTTLTPNQGRSVLVLNGHFSGDFDAFVKAINIKEEVFYLTDVDNAKPFGWQYIPNEIGTTFSVYYFVMTGKAPYTLHSTLGIPWIFELKLLDKNGGTTG